MASKCRVFRGLVKEVEEEVNLFFSTETVRLLQMAQSETGDHVTLTLIVESLDGPDGDER